MLAACRHLVGDMRVGEVGARHAYHVELAAQDGVARGGDVLDAGRVEGRQAGRRADLAREIKVRSRA